MIRLIAIAVFAFVASTVAAQQQPYRGMQQRPIKALSEQEIADLRAGRGMGFALPAELNGYPGPVHVLEHADKLNLTQEQRDRTRALFEAMKAETIPLGGRLIDQEVQLDRAFARRAITPTSLAESTAAIGTTRAALRAAHLRYHLAQVDVLTPQQIQQYNELRGYAAGVPGHHGSHHPGDHHAK